MAERYDIAIISTKGMPVVACRQLADILCGENDIPLLVLHDFDKAGFSILGTLQDIDHAYQFDDYGCEIGAKRYEFNHDIKVIDLGVRLSDVEAYGLEAEPVKYRSDPSDNLRENGATDEEIKFLCGAPGGYGRRGKRVELNAFTSGDFVRWIESKLDEHGIKKVVPDTTTLETAYRRAAQITLVHEQLPEIVDATAKQVENIKIPKTLGRMVRKGLEDDPKLPWDRVIFDLAATNCKERAKRRGKEAS
ncbi:MAG: hypothetical protein ABIP48_21495 [Planctomycetota bacterium]